MLILPPDFFMSFYKINSPFNSRTRLPLSPGGHGTLSTAYIHKHNGINAAETQTGRHGLEPIRLWVTRVC